MIENEGFWINGGLHGSGSSATLSMGQSGKFSGVSWVFLMNRSYIPGGMMSC